MTGCRYESLTDQRYLERDHEKRLSDLCAMRGLPKSAVVAAAMASFLSPDGADRREAAIARRLESLTNQFDRLSRDQTVSIETIALYIRYQLSITAPLPEAHQEAARAQGNSLTLRIWFSRKGFSAGSNPKPGST